MASAIANCVSGLPHVSSKSSDKEKEVFLARVEWLPVTSRSHGRTDKCKISIMIYIDRQTDRERGGQKSYKLTLSILGQT